ncbi:hypothetical protein HOLleu_13099 [Holothuria leucospilota]|uniref:Uncharacterized protein n=1 Tax=Holothuria leucospilota TaxID=206669 RepID=A0A9Q1CCE4_HOLLE|nr:hypothetical protein HOLleu_13099 [Holothuria leucospilota]
MRLVLLLFGYHSESVAKGGRRVREGEDGEDLNMMAFREPEIVQAVATQDDLIKRQSKIGSFFRSQLRNSFRSSFRIWGSADALNSDRSKSTSHTPPKTPPSSPRLRSKSAQHELRSDNYLMPPPNPFHGRKSKKKAGRRSRSPDPAGMKRSGSDSDLLDDSPHHHIYII